MANQTLQARALRRIWTQLPLLARRRLIGQLVFMLRPVDLGALSEPICYLARLSQPSRRRRRPAINSTPGGHHPDSRHRQYQVADRARTFGWPARRRLVIDDDLGILGVQSNNRPGHQRLVSMVALREVGIIFGLEVSRLVATAWIGN